MFELARFHLNQLFFGIKKTEHFDKIEEKEAPALSDFRKNLFIGSKKHQLFENKFILFIE